MAGRASAPARRAFLIRVLAGSLRTRRIGGTDFGGPRPSYLPGLPSFSRWELLPGVLVSQGISRTCEAIKKLSRVHCRFSDRRLVSSASARHEATARRVNGIS